MWGGALCLPLGSPKPPPLTLHTHPLRVTLGLAHFGGWGSPFSLCICAIGGSPQPQPWRPSSVSPTKLGRNLFTKTGIFPSKPGLVLFQVLWSTLLVLQEPCDPLASIYGAATEHLVVKASTPPLPCFTCSRAALYCALFLIAGTGIEKF